MCRPTCTELPLLHIMNDSKLPSYTVEAKSVNQFKSALQKLRTTQIGFFLAVSTSA